MYTNCQNGKNNHTPKNLVLLKLAQIHAQVCVRLQGYFNSRLLFLQLTFYSNELQQLLGSCKGHYDGCHWKEFLCFWLPYFNGFSFMCLSFFHKCEVMVIINLCSVSLHCWIVALCHLCCTSFILQCFQIYTMCPLLASHMCKQSESAIAPFFAQLTDLC